MDSLTLAEREAITGRSILCQDAPGEPFYCGDCLADLPTGREGQGAHRCAAPAPQPGDLVWLYGPVPEGYGRLYEVTSAHGATSTGEGWVYLWDCGQAIRAPGREVVVIRSAAEQAAIAAGKAA